MKDTSTAMEKKFHEMLMSRSGVERLQMGFDMFDSARAIMRAGFQANTETEMRIALFRRTYGGDFDRETADRICAWLAGRDAREIIETHSKT